MIDAGTDIPEVRTPSAPVEKSFSQAFREARNAKLKEFVWRGRRYGTKYKSEMQSSKPATSASKTAAPRTQQFDMSAMAERPASTESISTSNYDSYAKTLSSNWMNFNRATTQVVNTPKTLPNKTRTSQREIDRDESRKLGITFGKSLIPSREERMRQNTRPVTPTVATDTTVDESQFAPVARPTSQNEMRVQQMRDAIANQPVQKQVAPAVQKTETSTANDPSIIRQVLKKIDLELDTYGRKIGKKIGGIEEALINAGEETYNDFINTIEEAYYTTKDVDMDIVTQWAKRKAEKEGLIDIPEPTIKKVPTKKVEEKPKPETFYQEIGKVLDKGYSKDSLLSYRSQWPNDNGFEYIPTGVRKTNTGFEIDNVEGVGHFLLDASARQGEEYNHDYNRSFLESAKKHDDYVPVFKNTGKPDKSVIVKYKKPSEILPDDVIYSPLRQHKFDNIQWDKSKQAPGFAKNIKTIVDDEYEKTYGTSPYLLFKTNKDSYSRFSGLSVVFIWNDKYGNRIVRDFAGPIEAVRAEGEQIKKDFGLKANDLVLGYHDVGSFSAKPAAKDGKLKAKQWAGFNNDPWTGGALIIPKQNKKN
jgi:nucleoside diphosphate kinase